MRSSAMKMERSEVRTKDNIERKVSEERRTVDTSMMRKRGRMERRVCLRSVGL